MNRENAERFYMWLETEVAEDEQHIAEQQIHMLLWDHPEWVDEYSWDELWALGAQKYPEAL